MFIKRLREKNRKKHQNAIELKTQESLSTRFSAHPFSLSTRNFQTAFLPNQTTALPKHAPKVYELIFYTSSPSFSSSSTSRRGQLENLTKLKLQEHKSSLVGSEDQTITLAHLFYRIAFYFTAANIWEIVVICVVRLAICMLIE